jgi:hypothetical protein
MVGETGPGSIRDGMRWGLLLAAVAVTGYRLPATFRNFQEWRATLAVDPMAAELYKKVFTVNAVGIVVILGVAVGVFYLLRQRTARQP